MVQLKKFTLHRGPIIQTKMSLVTAGTDYMLGEGIVSLGVMLCVCVCVR